MSGIRKHLLRAAGIILLLTVILTAPSLFVYRDGVRELNLRGPLLALQDFVTQLSSDDFFVVQFGKTPRNIIQYIPAYLRASSTYLAAGSAASLVLGLGLGLLFGLRPSRFQQGIMAFFSAVPDFILVITLQVLSVFLYQTFHFRLGRINYAFVEGILLMPFLTMLVVSLSYTSRVSARYTIQTLSEEYIRYARAKGLSRRRIIVGHVIPGVIHSLRGSLLKIISLNLGTLFIIERMFNMPGLTRLLFRFGFSLEYSTYRGISAYTANLRIALTVVILLSGALFITYLIVLTLLNLIKKAAEHAVRL